jgi:DNA repair ATPase RecN
MATTTKMKRAATTTKVNDKDVAKATCLSAWGKNLDEPMSTLQSNVRVAKAYSDLAGDLKQLHEYWREQLDDLMSLTKMNPDYRELRSGIKRLLVNVEQDTLSVSAALKEITRLNKLLTEVPEDLETNFGLWEDYSSEMRSEHGKSLDYDDELDD